MTLKYRGSNQPRFDLSSRTSQERSIEKEEETISKFLDKAYEFNSWNFFSLDSFTECFSLWKKTHEIFSIKYIIEIKNTCSTQTDSKKARDRSQNFSIKYTIEI